ncbi:MAG: HEAT repeat domain-containing protein [Candidatus Riflebacteria bacterium]|nr:HEAT repeat domain-containing protein [Candidatus Riflebacteria bacterium]
MNIEQKTRKEDSIESATKSLRLLAIEKVIQNGNDLNTLQELENRLKEEEDEECKFLLQHAVKLVSQRLKSTGSNKADDLHSSELSAEEFTTQWLVSEARQKLVLLDQLDKPLLEKLSQQAPEMLKKEKNPVIAATLIRTFTPLWPREHLKIIADHLSSPSLSLKLAAFEALTQISPELLVTSLPALLTTDDLRMRAIAIRALAKLGPEEAIYYFERQLMQGNSSQREAAIQYSFYLPFEMAKPILLSYISLETDADLLERVGAILAANPDIQTPFQLVQSIENTSQTSKKNILKKILGIVMEDLRASQILGDKFAEYQKRLQEWIRKRGALRFAQECINRLESSSIDSGFEAFVLKQITFPEVKLALQDALTWPVQENTKTILKKWLEDKSEANSPAIPNVSASIESDFENLTQDGKIRFIARLSSEDVSAKPDFISRLWANKQLPLDLRTVILRTAGRLKVNLDMETVEPLVNSTDDNLASAALEYMGLIDPERLFPRLGIYMQSFRTRLKVVALSILKRFDQEQALNTLQLLLLSVDLEKQRMALASLVYFDFPLVRTMLADFLRLCSDPRLFEGALCLFDANPDPDNLFILFSLEKELPIKSKELNALRRRQGEQLLAAEVVNQTDLLRWEVEYSRRWETIQNTKPITSPLKVRKINQINEEERGVDVSPWLWRVGLPVIILMLILNLMVTFLVQPAVKTVQEKKGYPILASKMEIKGSIVEVDKTRDSVILFDKELGSFLLRPGQDKFPFPNKGDRAKAVVVPYRKNSQGVVLCRTTMIQLE